MAKYKINDTVMTKETPHLEFYKGRIGSIIGVFAERPSGKHFEQFPEGVVYAVEFEGGEATDIHEFELVKVIE